MQTEVILSLGGNKGDRRKLLFRAIEELNNHFQLLKVSKIYETSAWGGVAKGDFLNQIAIITTEYGPEDVLDIIQEIESNLGRTREEPWGDRTMDIDILFFGESVIYTNRLTIPHPFIAERKFVLVPMAELLPDKIHPITGKNFLQMLAECEDQSDVEIWLR
jgi:2-amino-4-hydroxy-6-hydroxymethyldihydropteridine diphosphokinase